MVLHPASDFSAEIECSLKHVSFKNTIPYEALSWVWGDPQPRASISLDNGSLPITRSLEQALRHLRSATGTRTLWVDAICINQRNIAERNRQVVLMKNIYSTCTTDLVWLGKATRRLTRALEITAQLQRSDIESIRNGKPALDVLKRNSWIALYDLFVTPPIWKRVWIMQELAYAQKVVLVLGTVTLDWDTISRLLDHGYLPDVYHGPYSHQRIQYNINHTFRTVQTIEHQREAVQKRGTPGHESRLIDVLARFRDTNATDPRDKIYGLLGLASDGLDVCVDYNKSVQDVYVDFFQTFVNTTKDLDLICQNPWGVPKVKARSQGLPSWCPDFSEGGKKTLLFAQRSIFGAGSKNCKVPCTISNGTHLKLDGISLGHLPTTSEYNAEYQVSFPRIRTRTDLVRESYPAELLDAESGAHPAIYAATGESLFDAYWRTLIADCYMYPTQRLTPALLESHRTIFHDWRKTWHNYEVDNDEELEEEDNTREEDDTSDTWITRRDRRRFMREIEDIKALETMGHDWRFAVTETGFYCLAPRKVKESDEVVILHGGKVPMVIRPVKGRSEDGESCYEVIGGAYVHGFMDGQAAQWVERGELKEGSFTLI